MNRLLSLFFVNPLVICPAFASEFACLKALIPATDHYWVHKNRTQYSLPQISRSGSALSITEWDNGRLIGIYVYTESTSMRFDQFTPTQEEVRPRAFRTLEKSWLDEHELAFRLDDMEILNIHAEAPRDIPKRTLANAADRAIGGWMIQQPTSPEAILIPIRKEIALRETWVKNNNLDTERFKEWSKADKECRGIAAPK